MNNTDLVRKLIREFLLNESQSNNNKSEEYKKLRDAFIIQTTDVLSSKKFSKVKYKESVIKSIENIPEDISKFPEWYKKSLRIWKGWEHVINPYLKDIQNLIYSPIKFLNEKELTEKLNFLEGEFKTVENFINYSTNEEGEIIEKDSLEEIVSTYFGDKVGISLTNVYNKYESFDIEINVGNTKHKYEIKRITSGEIPTGLDGQRAASTFIFHLNQFLKNHPEKNDFQDEINKKIEQKEFNGEYINKLIKYFVTGNQDAILNPEEKYKIGNKILSKKVYDAVVNYLLLNFNIKLDDSEIVKPGLYEYANLLKTILMPSNSFRNDIDGLFIVKSPNLVTYIKKEDFNEKLEISRITRPHGKLATKFKLKNN